MEILLVTMVVVACVMSAGLLITELLWWRMPLDERMAIAPFFSIAITILGLKALRQFSGLRLPMFPRFWILAGMAVITMMSVAVMLLVRARRASSGSTTAAHTAPTPAPN
ncbi:hypothetical protein HY632_00710 [Candidatus Uhrbacteria bacterium]|nr:hypothetical protein [Candidatus Uhrbacteria bacterium]